MFRCKQDNIFRLMDALFKSLCKWNECVTYTVYDKLLNRFWQQTRHCKEVGGAGAYVLVRHISIVGLPNNFYASAYWHKCTRMVPCSAYSTQRRFFLEIVWSINIKYGSCAILIGISYFSKTLFELTCKLLIICFTHGLRTHKG